MGQTATLRAAVYNGAGSVVTDRRIFWSSKNPAIATVSEGVVTGVAAGATEIAATADGKSAIAQVTVSLIPVASVRISPTSRSLQAGTSFQLTAEALGAAGQTLAGRGFTWTTSDAAVATVSSSGLATAVGPGSATITATSEGRSAAAAVSVSAIPVASVSIAPAVDTLTQGRTRQFAATARDAQGGTIAGRVVAWSTSAPTIATISSTGLLTAFGSGNVIVTATVEGRTATAAIHVKAVPVASVALTPPVATVAVGETAPFFTQVMDATGAVLQGRVVTYRSTSPAVASVSASGSVTGVALGAAGIIATSEGVSDTANVTVIPLPVATIEIAPLNAFITVGAGQLFSVTLKGAAGQVLQGRVVTWLSGSPSVATVSQNGIATGVGAGTALIFATSEGKTASATLTVAAIGVVSVSVSPASATLQPGGAVQLTATPLDGQGAPLSGRVVTWASANDLVASVSSTGRVTATGIGSTIITATSEGRSGSATITVAAPAAGSISVAPATVTVPALQQVTLLATLRDGSGAVITGPITWTTSNAAVVSVTSAGVARGLVPGSATITATSGSLVATCDITVSAVPVASVQVTLNAPSVNPGQSTQATAVTMDGNRNVLTGRAITWTTSDAGVATVNGSGAVSGVAPGQATITATSEGKSGAATIAVTAASASSIAVAPTSLALVTLQQATLSATLRDAGGNVVTGPLTWTTSSAAVATVTSAGVVRALLPGSATITVTSGALSATSIVTVSFVPVSSVQVTLNAPSVNPGQTTQATAVTMDGSGNVLTGRAITWTTSDAAVATVNGSGVVSGVSPGQATVTATSEGKSGMATIAVTAASAGSIAVAPTSLALVTLQQATLSATLRDAGGNVITGPLAWTTSNAAVAGVSSAGVVRGLLPGSATVTVTSGSLSATCTITVTFTPVSSVIVTLNASSIDQGQGTQATAVTKDASGNVLSGRPIAWSTSDAAVATVNANGAVSGVGAGQATITATSEGVAGTASLTVNAAPVNVSSVVLTPGSDVVVVGSTRSPSPFTAQTLDASGTPLTGRSIAWSTTNAGIASISSSGGALTGVSVGSTLLIAASEGKADSATVNVIAVPVASVSVTPTIALARLAQKTTFSAVARDSAGGAIASSPVITWSASPAVKVSPATATGSAMTVTATDSGLVTITATSGGQSQSVTLTISAPAAIPIVVSPSTLATNVGWTDTLTASGVGGPLSGAVTWTSSDTRVATVTSLPNNRVAVSGVSNGQVTVRAQLGSISAAVATTVGTAPLDHVAINPPAITFSNLFFPIAVLASARDARGNLLTGAQYKWRSSDKDLDVTPSSTSFTIVSIGKRAPSSGTYPDVIRVDADLGGIKVSRFLVVTVP